MSNSKETAAKFQRTSFWEFLVGREAGVETKVEIPIIQRDYAQGREGKESLRKKFLKDLKDALGSGKQLKLDFVYGSEKKERLQPLDGQQRLTTLWLLHWYIAYKADKINTCAYTQEEIDGEPVAERRDKMGKTTVADILKRFTYETRISSREFCENLCKSENFESFDGVGIVDFIKDQTWFYSAWKQDPTIQSMLRMLGGTGTNDGIEGVFEDKGGENYKKWWDYLTSDNAPIIFYYLSLENFGLSDDLYVKMNARGKPLTPFENFKAGLIGYLHGRADEEGEEKTRWENLLKPKNGVSIKLDTDWTKIFWDNKSEENKIDEIYFIFLKRFFWNELFTAKDPNKKNHVLTLNGEENKNPFYRHFNEDNCSDYPGIEDYKFLNGEIPVTFFEKLQNVLDNYLKYNNKYKKKNKTGSNFPDNLFPKWIRGDFEFIPKYRYNEKHEESVSTLTQVQRIMFFALCKYFYDEDIGKKADDIALKRWMRVVCNLVSGKDETGKPHIRSTDAMRPVMERIGALDSHDIYDSIIASKETLKTTINVEDFDQTAFGQIWNEEIAKAEKILEDREKWEAKIIDAEEYAFFNGAIRFLYQGEDGNEENGWNSFETKWESVKKYFKKNLKEDDNSCLNENFDNTNLLTALINQFCNIKDEDVDKKLVTEVLLGKPVFNNKANSWRYYLLNSYISGSVHTLLTKDLLCDGAHGTPRKLLKGSEDSIYSNILYWISKIELLDFLVSDIPNASLTRKYDHWAIYEPYHGCVFLDAQKRDAFFQSKEVIINNAHKIDNCNLLSGLKAIYFEYNGDNFAWWNDDGFIYLQSKKEVKDNSIRRNSPQDGRDRKQDKEDLWYCVNPANYFKDEKTIEEQNDDILRALKNLAKEATENGDLPKPPSNS